MRNVLKQASHAFRILGQVLWFLIPGSLWIDRKLSPGGYVNDPFRNRYLKLTFCSIATLFLTVLLGASIALLHNRSEPSDAISWLFAAGTAYWLWRFAGWTGFYLTKRLPNWSFEYTKVWCSQSENR
jgi:hypothetical protein